MKIAVIGAGGLGGYMGGRLAHAGEDVIFIARGERLRAMRRQGLQIRSLDGDFTVAPIKVTDDPAEAGPVDLILFCVKTYDVESAARMIRTMVGPQTAVLPVQNGIAHMEQLRLLAGDAVLGGVALIGAHSTTPGIVEQMGSMNDLEFGELSGEISGRCRQIERTLVAAGIHARAVPNITERMWGKFTAICGASVFVVTRGSKAQIWETPEVRDLMRRAIAEGVAIARAKGIPLPATHPDTVVAMVDTFPPQYKPSMLVDLEQGRRLELEAWNGSLSRMGKEMGVPTPINDFIYACLKPYVNGAPQQA